MLSDLTEEEFYSSPIYNKYKKDKLFFRKDFKLNASKSTLFKNHLLFN